jgi:hypothetical protein
MSKFVVVHDFADSDYKEHHFNLNEELRLHTPKIAHIQKILGPGEDMGGASLLVL